MKKVLIIILLIIIVSPCVAFADQWPVKWTFQMNIVSGLGPAVVTINEVITATEAATLLDAVIAETEACAAGATVVGAAQVVLLGALLGTAAYLIVDQIQNQACELYEEHAPENPVTYKYYHLPNDPNVWARWEVIGSGSFQPGTTVYDYNQYLNQTDCCLAWSASWQLTGTDGGSYENYQGTANKSNWSGGNQLGGNAHFLHYAKSATVIVENESQYQTVEDEEYTVPWIPTPEETQQIVNDHPEAFSQENMNPQIVTDTLPTGTKPNVQLPTPTTTSKTGYEPDPASTTGVVTDPATGDPMTPQTDPDMGTLTPPDQPTIIPFDTSMDIPTIKSIPDLLSDWINHAPFVQIFTGYQFSASGDCNLVLPAMFGVSQGLSFCKYASVFAALSAIIIAIAYIYAAIIITIGR
jgi:hypothetical protein